MSLACVVKIPSVHLFRGGHVSLPIRANHHAMDGVQQLVQLGLIFRCPAPTWLRTRRGAVSHRLSRSSVSDT